MNKTRMSLFYLAGYTWFGGAGFLFFPQLSLKMFFATGEYENLMVRMVGMFMIAIAIIITQLIRHHADVLYPTTLMVRATILTCMTVFYFTYGDPLLLVLLAIVGLGFVLTGTAYILDKRSESVAAEQH